MKKHITVVVNLHREGNIAAATFESVIKCVELANKSGINTETLCVIDRGDEETNYFAKQYERHHSIHNVNFGDLSASRNYAVAHAKGKYTTFIDGDDIWGYKWLTSCYKLAEELDGKNVIIHPRMNLYFGRDAERYFWIHPDMRYDVIDYDDILVSNRWTALSFSNTNTYKKFPYFPNELNSGFGYEDWLWHVQTIYNGYIHIVSDDTIHFIRRKKSGSLLVDSNDKMVLPNIGKLIEKSNVVV